MRRNGLANPRTQNGKVAARQPPHVPDLADADTDLLRRDTGRRTAVDRLRRKKLAAPLVISVGTLCKRR